MAIATVHGEGRAIFDSPEAKARALVALRFIDNRGAPTEIYPLNPKFLVKNEVLSEALRHPTSPE